MSIWGEKGKLIPMKVLNTKIDFICIEELNTEKETMNVLGKNSVLISTF